MEDGEFKNKLDNNLNFEHHKMFPPAYAWAKRINDISESCCLWSWDCGLKLDYDGTLCTISSRFYPPHKSQASYGLYHGTISVYVLDTEVHNKKIEAPSLDELQKVVEAYVLTIESKIAANIKAVFSKK